MYKPTIGLEIHIQLMTETKIFCSCSIEFARVPNTNICPVCIGLPGALPVLNEKVVEYGVKLGIALKASINRFSSFYRKNYFYPDLPKGYQITQYAIPIAKGGYLEIGPAHQNRAGSQKKKIRIEKAHIEEDSGKSIHMGDITESEFSLIDFNRSGIPLLEIVTLPDIETPDEAYDFLILLRSIVRYIGVSTGDMEKGAMRCDVNISVSKDETMGTKVEIKNLNSFRSVKRALEYEIERQIGALKKGERIVQETRHFDEKEDTTKPMRTKEELNDYRYFPEPDLPPLVLSDEFIENIKNTIPELPNTKEERYIKEFEISSDYARTIAYHPKLAEYFENIVKYVGIKMAKDVANFIMVDLSAYLNETKKEIDKINFTKEKFKELLDLIDNKTISRNTAKEVINESLRTGKTPSEIVSKKGCTQITDEDSIKKLVIEVLNENETQVKQYLSGETKVIGFLVGQTMKKSKGKANPELVNRILYNELENLRK
jgi:aspartyl-tRNA(Asn)/glutamyl-tRNA(Gln) amidotransferase subunit B